MNTAGTIERAIFNLPLEKLYIITMNDYSTSKNPSVPKDLMSFFISTLILFFQCLILIFLVMEKSPLVLL